MKNLLMLVFYFKDDTILNIKSDNGIYNNKTLDMIFEKNVKADYKIVNFLLKKLNIQIQKFF